jgi:hypothetical protein
MGKPVSGTRRVMTVSTNLSFQSPYVVFTVSVGVGHRLEGLDVTVTWNPTEMKRLQTVTPSGGQTIPGGVYWPPRDHAPGTTTEYKLQMCRKGMNFPLVTGVARDVETDTEYSDFGHAPGSFSICAAQAQRSAKKASKAAGKKARRRA